MRFWKRQRRQEVIPDGAQLTNDWSLGYIPRSASPTIYGPMVTMLTTMLITKYTTIATNSVMTK